ncbi:MAG: RagB/SusD family nutrient uptake outer membrane protein [Bacteroidales bacterium]|nr:RagB/SusD family nutrient uptake outer membrane protein [Bacteroidales bacterium]MBD5211900.1 RagB/SusD family nutrient uptake outer membrane protein [Bacteroidales bacterium]MBD5218193.1 RagB/SusD family nutrient uptake outer membrane protein [Bacteroidales bacterium]MBD5222102.1 RagB/SusD family nutrient uptake outer membrane protein [Bacteroidales bacterium]
MKFNKILLAAGIMASAMSFTACTGDLDLTPTDQSFFTPDQFAADPDYYLDATIAGVYQQHVTYGANGNAAVENFDGGMSTFQRAIFILQEMNSDEASWLPMNSDYGMLTYGIVPSSNTAVMGTYSRFYINMGVCNQFIHNIRDGYFGTLTEAQQKKADEYIRQANILRLANLYYVLDIFGNVPYVTEDIRMGNVAPQLSTNFAEGRRMVYERLAAELEDIVAWYKENDPNNKPAYGYVGLDVAESLLVKLYLNAEVYSGTAQWQKCWDHAEAIIARLGHGGFNNAGLCNAYLQNFAANNAQFCIDGNNNAINEIIWILPQAIVNDVDGNGITSYANGTFMLNAWIGNSTADDTFTINNAEYNSKGGWKCMTARREFVEKFDWDANYAVSPDARVALWKTAKDGFNINNTTMGQAEWGHNGYLAIKYSNWAIDDNGAINEAASPEATDQNGVDYAMIRLAEIYLSAAEAAYNGFGDKGKALTYVNNLRERAGLAPYTSLNLTELQDERCRELYTESTRRTDLIRYGKWLSGYNWAWKHNVRNGADFDPYFIVYPIPSTTAARNGYTQNPGY